MKGKPRFAIPIVVTLALALGVLSSCGKTEERIAAEEAFDKASDAASTQFTELQDAISSAELLAATGEPLLDQSLMDSLNNAISDAKTIELTIPEMPKSTEEIQAATNELKAFDCYDKISAIQSSMDSVKKNIDQYKLVDNPTEAYVIEKLGNIDGISDIEAVTEENDPNGNLHKDGGYTASVYFASDAVDTSKLSNANGSSIEKGTDGGGCVEVYATADEAKKRDAYLAGFDGSVLASGSHAVVGTVVVRTSNNMTASSQDDLEARIIAELVAL